jgi:hypothetical protein
MKKIVLLTTVLAFVASSSFAVSLFINPISECESTQNIEMTIDQGEKTKSKETKKEETAPATTEKKASSSSKKSSCKKSCEKSCDKKGSKSKS